MPPTYDYRCPKCGNETELFKKITDTTIPQCEKCHADMKQVIRNGSFQLKGEGWFKTGGHY